MDGTVGRLPVTSAVCACVFSDVTHSCGSTGVFSFCFTEVAHHTKASIPVSIPTIPQLRPVLEAISRGSSPVPPEQVLLFAITGQVQKRLLLSYTFPILRRSVGKDLGAERERENC